MTAATVVKTIGSTGVFSTLQLWEDGAPANLTTAEKSAATTFLVAAFVQGETLSFVGSGAAGKFLDTDSTGAGNGSYITYGITSGNPAASDVVTGATSGATCVLSSGTPTNVGVVWQGQCQNQEFSGTGTQITLSGSTSSSTAYKELTTVPGASFRDNANAQTNALSYNASNGCGIRGTSASTVTVACSELNSHLSNLQITATGSGGRGISGAGSQFWDNLIVEGKYTATTSSIGVISPGSSTIRNSVIILRASGADHIVGTSTVSPNFYNCTFVAPDDLANAPTSIFLSGASGTVTVQNCSMFAGDSSKAIKAGSATFNFTTCYSDISGTTGVTQATYSSEFQNVNNATSDFRLKAGAAQADTGTTDSTNAANDIVGTARPSGSAYDVGCWELVVASNKTLTADAGSYSLTGTTAAILQSRKVVPDAGSYVLSGTGATLRRKRLLVSGSESYTIIGTDASSLHKWLLVGETNSYVLAGTDATLVRNLPLVVDVGSYALVGTAAIIKQALRVSAISGSYSLDGTDVGLSLERLLSTSTDSYIIAGADAALTKSSAFAFFLAVDSGFYEVVGTDVTFKLLRKVIAESDIYIVAGDEVSLVLSKRIAPKSGSYIFRGHDAVLLHEQGAIVELPHDKPFFTPFGRFMGS